MPRNVSDGMGGTVGGGTTGRATAMGQSVEGGMIKRPPSRTAAADAQKAKVTARNAKIKTLAKRAGKIALAGGAVAGYIARENAIKEADAKKAKEFEKLKKQSPGAADFKLKQDYENAVKTIKKGY